MKSGVIGALADRAADAVGAEIGSAHVVDRRACRWADVDYRPCRDAARQTASAVDGRGHVVHAHDARAAAARSTRDDAAAATPRPLAACARPAASTPPVSAPSVDLRDQPDQQRAAEREQLALARAAARDCAPASCRSRCPDRATMRSRAMPAAAQRRARSREEGARPRRRRRRSRRRACIVRGVAAACASGRRRSAGCAATTSSAPGARSAATSLTMSTPSVERRAHHRRACRCRPRPARRASTRLAQHRQHARELARRRGTGARRAGVDSPPMSRMSAPSRDQPLAAWRARASASTCGAAVGERVGRDVDDAHHARPRQVDREAAVLPDHGAMPHGP